MFMYNFISMFVPIIFIIIFGAFIFSAVKGVKQWNYNNKQPVLSVFTKVVSKRTEVSESIHHDANNVAHHSSSTSYYITFQVESGDRMEFAVNGNEYGMLVEGDAGKLTFQGTRYLSFNRDAK